MLPLSNFTAVVDTPLLKRLRRPTTMHALIRTGADVVDVVIQDEFTHDVIIKVSNDLFAVYEST